MCEYVCVCVNVWGCVHVCCVLSVCICVLIVKRESRKSWCGRECVRER